MISMASGLEEAWKRLSLTEDEETVIECEDEMPNDKSEQISLCLWGKLHTESYFNVNAMKTVLKNVSKPSKRVSIHDLDKNLFAFQFFSSADKDFVQNEGPWAFDGNILLVGTITGFEQPSEVQFTHARFWVKAIDVLPIKQTASFAKVLGDNLGQFVSCDDSSLFCATDKSVNFLVEIDITKPLRRGMRVMVKGRPIWISFRYVKLPEFCYSCGRLGHVLSSFDLYREVVDESDLQYGDWLRGSPIKPLRRNAEAIKQEERRLFLAYRSGNSSDTSKKKLVFDSTAVDVMAVDKDRVIQPGNEAFKCKLIDRGKSPNGERKTRLVSDEDNLTPVSAEVAKQPRQEL